MGCRLRAANDLEVAFVGQLDRVNDMALVVAFLLGIGNFAVHKAVLESRHPILGAIPWYANRSGSRVGLGLEFLVLAGTMLMVGQGAFAWAWFYSAYSVINALAAWLILSRRI